MTSPAPPRHSIILPVFNEVASLDRLHRELARATRAIEGGWEFLFVDDGSTDGGGEWLAALAARDPHVRVLRFAFNAGKSAAYTAGFAESRGEIVLTLDTDLQDVPAEIPRLLEQLDDGADLVVGWKRERLQNEPTKKLPSIVYNGLKNRLFGLRLHDGNSGFRAMRRSVAASLRLFGDRYRFIPELAHLAGFRVVEIAVTHRKRRHGHSKYGPARFLTGLLDLLTVRYITAYAHRPLHFFGAVAAVPIGAGVLIEVYVLAQKLAGSTFQTHVAAIIIGALAIMVGMQLLATGLVGEMISDRQTAAYYKVRSRHGFGEHAPGERKR